MKQPLITIIVPVYNTAPYLSKCLDSICNQSYKNIEIICVNDGSTDISAEILNEYAIKDSRISVITQENLGLSSARNAALECAKGEWILGIDSDDWIEIDTCEYFVNRIQESDAKLVIYGLETYNGTRNQVIHRTRYKEGEIKPTPEFMAAVGNWFCNKIWHRSIIYEKHHRMPINLWWEDAVFFYKIAPYLDKILILPDIKYHYMRYDKGTSILDLAANFHPKTMDVLKGVEIVLQFYKENPLPVGMDLTGALFLQRQYKAFIINQIKLDKQNEAWNRLRKMVEDYDLLVDIKSLPLLSLYYNVPPTAVATLEKIYSPKVEVNKIKEQFELISNYNKLLRHYRLTQIKALFSWGARSEKYRKRKKKLKELLRRARYLRKSSWFVLKKKF